MGVQLVILFTLKTGVFLQTIERGRHKLPICYRNRRLKEVGTSYLFAMEMRCFKQAYFYRNTPVCVKNRRLSIQVGTSRRICIQVGTQASPVQKDACTPTSRCICIQVGKQASFYTFYTGRHKLRICLFSMEIGLKQVGTNCLFAFKVTSIDLQQMSIAIPVTYLHFKNKFVQIQSAT